MRNAEVKNDGILVNLKVMDHFTVQTQINRLSHIHYFSISEKTENLSERKHRSSNPSSISLSSKL